MSLGTIIAWSAVVAIAGLTTLSIRDMARWALEPSDTQQKSSSGTQPSRVAIFFDVLLQKTWLGAILLITIGLLLMASKAALWLAALLFINALYLGELAKNIFLFGVTKYNPDETK